ncbi:MAG: hypothetical protein AAGJ52_12640, partial [Pseudomonadota bacterium]
HPTSLMVIALPAGLFVLGALRHGLRPLHLIIAALVALLPFLPYLLDQQLNSWPLFQGLGEFQSGQAGVWSLGNALTIAWQLFGGGLYYCLDQIMGLPTSISAALTGLIVIVGLIGLLASIRLAVKGDRIALLFWIALVSGWLGLVGLRVVHPYYMLTPLWFVCTGLVAMGLSELIRNRQAAADSINRFHLPYAAIALVITLHIGLVTSAARVLHSGQWPFAFNPVMDIKQAVEAHRLHAFLSAVQSRQSGRWLCRQDPLAVHGPMALVMLHGYAMDARLACGDVPHQAGGSDSGRPAIVGISNALASLIDRQPVAAVGPFSVFNVTSHPRTQQSIPLESFRAYPPFIPAFNPESEARLNLDTESGDWVAVTHLGFALSRRPEVRVECNGEPFSPQGEDNTSWLYSLSGCSGELVLITRVSHPDHIDVVLF